MKIGFIGCGNMGECILAGILHSGKHTADSIYVFNRTPATVDRLCQNYGVQRGSSALDVATKADIIILGVKPYGICPMIASLRDAITETKLLVSIAAAITIASMEKALGKPGRIVRVMPNVPVMVGEGLTSVTPNPNVTPEETAAVLQLFRAVGKAVVVEESNIHAIIGVAGSSPAYVFMFMEAMGDAAVRGGLPRAQAYEYAAQAVLGAAKMLLTSGKSPAQLKDTVCSPGGTTIEAVRSLEKGGMRSAVIEAMIDCMEKSKELEKKLN